MICSTFDMGLKISIGSTFLYCFVVYLCISLFIFLQDNKKLVRYRDNQVVSTKGERFSWVKQQGNEENVRKFKTRAEVSFPLSYFLHVSMWMSTW